MLLIFAQLSGSKKKEIMENASAVIVVVFCASLPSPTYEFYMFLELILSKTYVYISVYMEKGWKNVRSRHNSIGSQKRVRLSNIFLHSDRFERVHTRST